MTTEEKPLKAFLNRMSPPERRQFAGACETNMPYMRQIANHYQMPSFQMAQRIERKSEGAVAITDWPDIDAWKAEKERA